MLSNWQQIQQEYARTEVTVSYIRFCLTHTFLLYWTKPVPSRILVRYLEAIYIFILIKTIGQFLDCKIPERVLLTEAISICKRFSKVSHRSEVNMCGLSLLAIFTFTLWHITLVLYSKRQSSITAPAPLTTKPISKQVRLNAIKSVLVNFSLAPGSAVREMAESRSAREFFLLFTLNAEPGPSLMNVHFCGFAQTKPLAEKWHIVKYFWLMTHLGCRP